MGNGMNKVLPGLYVGSYRDSKDLNQLEKFDISHVIAIHDSPKRLYPNLHYLMIMASDSPDQVRPFPKYFRAILKKKIFSESDSILSTL